MEYSSGCESGWTMYLAQSAQELTSVPANNDATGGCYQEEEDVEDLSMVSDASSGPPVFHEEEEEEQNYCKENVQQKNGQWKQIQRKGRERHDTVLEDTASSHAPFKAGNLGVTKKNASVEDVVDFSMGFSFTDCKRKSAFQEQYSRSQMPPPGKATSAKPAEYARKRAGGTRGDDVLLSSIPSLLIAIFPVFL